MTVFLSSFATFLQRFLIDWVDPKDSADQTSKDKASRETREQRESQFEIRSGIKGPNIELRKLLLTDSHQDAKKDTSLQILDKSQLPYQSHSDVGKPLQITASVLGPNIQGDHKKPLRTIPRPHGLELSLLD